MGKKKLSRKNKSVKRTSINQKKASNKEKKRKINTVAKSKKKIVSKRKDERVVRASPVVEILKRPDVRKLLIDVGGENAMEVIRLLAQYGEDEKIAEKLRVKVSDIRSVLNKFHSEGIVSYERTKDEETGWYYYNWKLNTERLNEWIEKRMNADREFILAKIREGEHYFCPKCISIPMIMKFEEAADYNFKCPKCRTAMELLDEEKVGKLIKNESSRG